MIRFGKYSRKLWNDRKIWRKSKLNSEKIWKIDENYEKIGKIWMKCEMIWKIWKKSKLKSEKIWKIWKKGKLYGEMIWQIWKISVLVIITPKETSSSSSSSSSLPPSLFPTILLFLLLSLYIVFQNWEESSWNSFLLETMQIGIKFTICLLEIPQWERRHPLEYYTTYIYIYTLYENIRGR